MNLTCIILSSAPSHIGFHNTSTRKKHRNNHTFEIEQQDGYCAAELDIDVSTAGATAPTWA